MSVRFCSIMIRIGGFLYGRAMIRAFMTRRMSFPALGFFSRKARRL